MSRLHPRQIAFRITRPVPRCFGRIRRRRSGPVEGVLLESLTSFLRLHTPPLRVVRDYLREHRGALVGSFLNLAVDGADDRLWADRSRGLLWNYHLHYLAWLHDGNVGSTRFLFRRYAERGWGQGASFDPYPTTLRIVNVVKASALGTLAGDRMVSAMLADDSRRLASELEYHLLGNHLLENAFGLVWGGFATGKQELYERGRRIVLSQLREQVLADGGHFERTPTYHCLILERVLDTLNLLRGSRSDDSRFIARLTTYARRMLGWLRAYAGDGEAAPVNDASPGAAPSPAEIYDYAERLGLSVPPGTLGDSGFRVYRTGEWRVLADVGSVGPRYQPGHAHAGTLSFVLWRAGHPVLVDTGVSTYEDGPRRRWERSTAAHNTVRVGGLNSSEVWSSFRVARRARATVTEEAPTRLAALHDGYVSRLGVVHQRTWEFADNSVMIADTLQGRDATRHTATATFIFAPGRAPEPLGEGAWRAGDVMIRFNGARHVQRGQVYVGAGFNLLQETRALRVRFCGSLQTVLSGG